jgi:hypothetical protein
MTDEHREATASTRPMVDDPIVAEVRATREGLAAALNCDLARIVEDLRQVEAVERARGRQIVAPPNPVSGTAA